MTQQQKSRSAGEMIRPFVPAALLALLTLVFFSGVLFGGMHFWEDLVYQEYPNRIFMRDCFQNGIFPHWNPNTFGGMPFFAAIQPGVLYPVNLLIAVLPLSNDALWQAISWSIAFHIFVAGLGMYLLARSRRHSTLASLTAAAGYMFCGFFTTHVIHSMMLDILAWLPLVVLLIDKGHTTGRITPFAGAGLLLGLTVLGGHPQLSFYEFLFVGALSLWNIITIPTNRIKGAIFTGLLFVFAVGIPAVQLLPAAELGDQSARVNWSFEAASEGSISPAQLLMFLMPKLFGSWTGPDSSAPAFWLPGPHSGYYTYWDTNFYTGIAIVIAAALAFSTIRRNRWVQFSALWGCVSLAMALGSYFVFYRFLFEYVPGFDRFRAPGRILFTWDFLLPLLAASSLDALRSPETRQRLRRPVLIISGVLATIGLATAAGLMAGFFPQLSDQKNSAHAATQGAILLLNTALIAIPLIMCVYHKLAPRTTLSLALAALVIDLFVFGMGTHQNKTSGAPAHFRQGSDLIAALRQDATHEQSRYSTRQFLLEDTARIGKQTGLMLTDRNQGMVDKIQLLEGYNPLNLYRRTPPLRGGQFDAYLDLLNVKYFVNTAYSQGSPNLICINEDRIPRASLFYRAVTLPNDTAVRDQMFAGFPWRSTLLLEKNPGITLNGDSTTRGVATITKYTPSVIECTVSTPAAGLLFLSEMWYPAWKATVDNIPHEVLCADYSFRAVAVDKGEHRVRFYFDSASFNRGLIISLITLAAAIGAITAGLFMSRPKTP